MNRERVLQFFGLNAKFLATKTVPSEAADEVVISRFCDFKNGGTAEVNVYGILLSACFEILLAYFYHVVHSRTIQEHCISQQIYRNSTQLFVDIYP